MRLTGHRDPNAGGDTLRYTDEAIASVQVKEHP